MGEAREPPGVVLGTGAYGEFEGADDDRVVFGAYRRDGTWAPGLVALLARLLDDGSGPGTLIDVGAHVGLVAVPTVERTESARCIAFEPAPGNFALLCRNVARHGLGDRVEVHELALSEQTGRGELWLSADNSGDHHLVHAATHAVPTHNAVAVRTARLDDVLAGRALASPVVMKLDCQGAEARVLQGAALVLERVDHLVVEWWPAGLVRMGDDTRKLHALLRAMPYATLIDQQTGPGPLQDSRAFLDSLAWIPSDGSDPGFFDLLLSRRASLSG